MCVHVVGGIYAYGRDILQPFSASEAAMEYIQKHHYDKLMIVGSKDALVFPFTAFINKEIYYPESESSGSFYISFLCQNSQKISRYWRNYDRSVTLLGF